MGTKYTSNTASGYNSTPPTDDGAQTEANKVKWSTIKNKLTDPLANQINAINTDVNTVLDYGPVSVVSAAVTLGSSHNNQFIELSGAATPTLDSSDGLGAGWYVDVKNVGTQVITMARERTNDTIDGTTADVTLNPLDYIRFVVNAAANGFYTVGIKKATAAQVAAGTASDAFITPEQLNSAVATQAEVNSQSDGYKYVTPSTLGGFMGRGCLVYNASVYSATDSTWDTLSFDNNDFDTDSIHDVASNNDRLTVPAGVSRVRLTGSASFGTDSTGIRQVRIIKNGSGWNGMPTVTAPPVSGELTILPVSSPMVSAAPGDYYTLQVYQDTGSDLPIYHGGFTTWFAMEIIK